MALKKEKVSMGKKGFFYKFLDFIETVGNKLPHPVTLFAIFCLAIMVISHLCALAGVSVEFTMIDRKTLETSTQNIKAVSLLTTEGIRFMFTSAVSNFTGFHPLGTVLVAMLGVGVAEGTGFISALLKKIVVNTPRKLVTAMVVFLGIMSNIASDAGYVVLVPLGAIIFLSFKRHPIAGLAAAFAGVSGGFSANLLIGTIDPLLGGITTEAAKLIDSSYSVTPMANYYFMFVSTFLITGVGTYVTEKIVEPRLGVYEGSSDVDVHDISKEESRGLMFAGISTLVFIGIIMLMLLPANSILRDPKTQELFGHSPFVSSIVFIIMLFFLIPGIAYGIAAGTVKSDKDVVKAMSSAMSTMGGYLVLSFVAAQFIKYFSYTNLGIILASNGASFLDAIGFKGLPLIVSFIIIAGFINLFIGSASAKWAIMAPVFVPMLMKLGFSPEFTQVAYRIGDSTTNIISPLMSYFAVIVAFANKYDEEAGIGTLISTMLPYSLYFLAGWTILLIIWFFTGAPIGLDSYIFL